MGLRCHDFPATALWPSRLYLVGPVHIVKPAGHAIRLQISRVVHGVSFPEKPSKPTRNIFPSAREGGCLILAYVYVLMLSAWAVSDQGVA